MSKLIVYAIPNCNTVKKTLDWLNKNKIEYSFHDYKKLGISNKNIAAWCQQVGWEILINKKGNTWRQLDPTIQSSINTQAKAIALMIEKTSVIKRPIIEKEGKILLIGFDEAEYKKALK